MFNEIFRFFGEGDKRARVAETLLKYGLKVKDGKIWLDEIEISTSKLAKALNVDRRTIQNTVKLIESNQKLKRVFENLETAGLSLKKAAKSLGLGVIEIFVKDPSSPGVIATVSSLIANEKISIRQIIAEDPYLHPEPKLIVITEKRLPGILIDDILRIKGIEYVKVSS